MYGLPPFPEPLPLELSDEERYVQEQLTQGLMPKWRLLERAYAHQGGEPWEDFPPAGRDPALSALATPAPHAIAGAHRSSTPGYVALDTAAGFASMASDENQVVDQAARRQIAALDWEGLAQGVADCQRCGLCQGRKQAVLGVGDQRPDWLFVGEGPGEEEDRRGEPFVGKAGQLLDAMLASIQLRRGDKVYIGNAVKCRPPHNRTPSTEEIHACFPYLERQIALLQPKVIVALGRPAAQALLGHEVKINAVRGKVFHYQSIPLVITYHPAYLLRNLVDKAKAWEDLCFMRQVMTDIG